MAISDFANDGAMGATGNSDGSSSAGSQSGSALGSNIVNDWAMNQSGSSGSDATGSGTPSSGSDAGGPWSSIPADSGNSYSGINMKMGPFQYLGVNGQYFRSQDSANKSMQQYMAARGFSPGNGWSTTMLEDGGAIPDEGGDMAGGADAGDVGSLLALALSSVDQGLSYGRKKYGLSQDGGQQMASMQRTPMVPGNQSESGIPRPQPMPGPLPPTSNPFGKRQQFGQNDQQGDNDADEHGGIPDNDEDDQETA